MLFQQKHADLRPRHLHDLIRNSKGMCLTDVLVKIRLLDKLLSCVMKNIFSVFKHVTYQKGKKIICLLFLAIRC